MATDSNGHNPTLSGKQSKALPVILACSSIAEGCLKARISRDTFYTWIKEPAFKAEFERQRKELVDLALHELKGAAGEAGEVLRKLLKAKNENVRLKAALGLLDHIRKFIELDDIEERLRKLERGMKK